MFNFSTLKKKIKLVLIALQCPELLLHDYISICLPAVKQKFE